MVSSQKINESTRRAPSGLGENNKKDLVFSASKDAKTTANY